MLIVMRTPLDEEAHDHGNEDRSEERQRQEGEKEQRAAFEQGTDNARHGNVLSQGAAATGFVADAGSSGGATPSDWR